jgi:Bacterial pre-peptidase C-terminal domain
MPKISCQHVLISALIAGFSSTQLVLSNSVQANPRTAIEPIPKVEIKVETKVEKLVYAPIQLPTSGEVTDTLSDRDIPTGEGGFARDYAIKLTAGDNIAIDLTSETFDTVVILLNAEGKNIAKNDDGSDGTSNSLLFTRIKKTGNYLIRVQGFGETSSGEFKLKVSKLR